MSHDDIKAALEVATPRPWDEEWRTIPDQIYYEVSDQGGVRSWRAQTRKVGANPRAESPHPLVLRNSQRDGRGYQTVSLPDATGRYVTKTVHSLVLAAFVGPRPDGLEIAHLNGDPSDNRLANLKYVTHQENESHKLAHGTRATGEDVNGARLLGWQVAEIRYLATQGVTQAKIAALFDLHSSHVSNIITGRIWPETLKRDTASPTWLAELLAEVDEAQAEAMNVGHDYDRRGERLWRLAALAGWTPGNEADNDATAEFYVRERLAEVDRLSHWKAEALPVIDGLQELGAELGIPLGKRITGPDALAAVKALAARAEAAEQAVQRVRELAQHYDGRAYTDATGAILRALDGGAS